MKVSGQLHAMAVLPPEKGIWKAKDSDLGGRLAILTEVIHAFPGG
jgi:hypothetical protein